MPQPPHKTSWPSCKAKNADLADQFLRAKAETENARRRAEDEVSPRPASSASRALPKACCPWPTAWTQPGHQGSHAQSNCAKAPTPRCASLTAALERNKVLAINPAAGSKFDPHQHQAISMVPAEQEANTVVTVLQKGYLIAERVLRPALVTVSRPQINSSPKSTGTGLEPAKVIHKLLDIQTFKHSEKNHGKNHRH
jgi:molecular chaperone GrpE